MALIDITDLTPNPHRCKSCPFNPEGDANLADKVRQRSLEASQICHGTEGPQREPRSLCRGARDYQIQILYRLGVLAQPTDQCWQQTYTEQKKTPSTTPP